MLQGRSWLGITGLSVGEDAGVVALEGVVEKTFPKALEDHLLACTRAHTPTHPQTQRNEPKCAEG